MAAFTPARPTVRILDSPSKHTPARREVLTSREPELTEADKQILLENLQLEVSERARKLRAQYAVQAQGLRSRFEMRINRIPKALRSMKIEDLLKKYADPTALNPPARLAGAKRSSHLIRTENKENQEAMTIPKKRAKTSASGAILTNSRPTISVSKPRPSVRDGLGANTGSNQNRLQSNNPNTVISPPHLQPISASSRNRMPKSLAGVASTPNGSVRTSSPMKIGTAGRPAIPSRLGSKQPTWSSHTNPSQPVTTVAPSAVSASIPPTPARGADRNSSPVKRPARAPRAAAAGARKMVRTDSNGSSGSSVTTIVRQQQQQQQQQRVVTGDSVSSTGTVKRVPSGRSSGTTTRKRAAAATAATAATMAASAAPVGGRAGTPALDAGSRTGATNASAASTTTTGRTMRSRRVAAG